VRQATSLRWCLELELHLVLRLAELTLVELRLRLEQVEARKAAVLERVQRMAVARDASAAAMQRLLQDTLALREEQRRLEGMKQGASPQLQCVRCAVAPPPPRQSPCPRRVGSAALTLSPLSLALSCATPARPREQAPAGPLL
jgi:hypothetical protein